MELTIRIISGLIYLSLFLSSAFCAYFFWRSVNGELRKIMIGKYLCATLFFLVVTIIVFVDPVGTITSISIIALPYVWQNVKLIRYLISTKN